MSQLLPQSGLIQSLNDCWNWKYLLALLIAVEVGRLYRVILLRPRNIKIVGAPGILGSWITAFTQTFIVQKLIFSAYSNAKDEIWAIPIRDKFHVCVSSPEHIEEFNKASQQEISLQGGVHELFPPRELYGGMPAGDKQGNLGLSQGIFRHSLRSHLPKLQPLIQDTLENGFIEDVDCHKSNVDGWTKISLHITSYKMAARLNSLVIVGQPLSNNQYFSKLLRRYLGVATLVEELLRIIPYFMKSIVGRTLMTTFGGLTQLRQEITPVLHERMNTPTSSTENKNMDCIQWSIDRSRHASIQDLTTHIVAMLFASTHQLPVLLSYTIYRLCLHPEYLEPLREETRRCSGNIHDVNNEDMPLLDSFLKEVARLHPITIVSMPHKVESHFTFSNGAYIPRGNWVSIPQQAIMQDPEIYSSPQQFQGFRFVDWADNSSPELAASKSRFSHPGHMFPYWGTLKHACPARFYVSMVSKMIIGHLITHYDVKLADPRAASSLHWGISVVPHPRLAVMIRKRKFGTELEMQTAS